MTIRDGNGAAPAVEMRGIVKRFPGVVANNGIEFAVRRGEIHALLGENGAGKSTLMNILFGLYHPDEGRSGSTVSRCGSRARAMPCSPGWRWSTSISCSSHASP